MSAADRARQIAARLAATRSRSSMSSESLNPSGAEEFDAVVGDRIVRRADHHAGGGFFGHGNARDRRRRNDADGDDVAPDRRNAGDDRRFEHRSREARVAADNDRAVTVARYARARLRRRVRFRTPVPASARSFATPRTPSVPKSRLTVWSLLPFRQRSRSVRAPSPVRLPTRQSPARASSPGPDVPWRRRPVGTDASGTSTRTAATCDSKLVGPCTITLDGVMCESPTTMAFCSLPT